MLLLYSAIQGNDDGFCSERSFSNSLSSSLIHTVGKHSKSSIHISSPVELGLTIMSFDGGGNLFGVFVCFTALRFECRPGGIGFAL